MTEEQRERKAAFLDLYRDLDKTSSFGYWGGVGGTMVGYGVWEVFGFVWAMLVLLVSNMVLWRLYVVRNRRLATDWTDWPPEQDQPAHEHIP